MTYHFKIHKDKTGYWAQCIELKGCRTQADGIDDLKKNAQEALNLYLDEPEESGVVIPLPETNLTGRNIIGVDVDPKLAFALNMRILRKEKGLTQKQAAELLGMKNIYSYQRLESARTANPNFSMILRIAAAFPSFRLDNIIVFKKPLR